MQKTREIQPINRQLGARLRQARRLCGLSQKQLGAALVPPISFQQVQKYENGRNRISVPTLQQFSAILHVPISFFMADVPENAAPMMTPQEAALLRTFRSTPPKLQAAIVALLQVRECPHPYNGETT